MDTERPIPQRYSPVQLGIKNHYNGLSKGQKRIADLYLDSDKYKTLVLANVADVAGLAGVSIPSVTRFVKLLGYPGYKEFQITLAQSNGADKKNGTEDQVYGMVSRNDGIEAICEKVFYSNIKGMQDTLGLVDYSNLERAGELIIKSTKVHFCGFGWSKKAADIAKARFQRIGINSTSHDSLYSIAKHVAVAEENEVFFGISISGHTRPVFEGLELAKKRGLKIITLTSQPRSPIDKLADIALYIVSEQGPDKAGYYSKDPSIGMIMSIILIDVLYMHIYMQTYDKASRKLELTMEALEQLSKL